MNVVRCRSRGIRLIGVGGELEGDGSVCGWGIGGVLGVDVVI